MTQPNPVYEQAEQAARNWFRAASRNPSELFFLYYLPHGMRLAVGTDAPGDGWELADHWRIPPALTEAQACEWIYTTARRLPLYPVEE